MRVETSQNILTKIRNKFQFQAKLNQSFKGVPIYCSLTCMSICNVMAKLISSFNDLKSTKFLHLGPRSTGPINPRLASILSTLTLSEALSIPYFNNGLGRTLFFLPSGLLFFYPKCSATFMSSCNIK